MWSNTDNFRIIKSVSEGLFSAEERRIGKALEDLHQKNRTLSERPGDGFSFAGDVYRSITAPARGMANFVPLHLSLTQDMLDIRQDRTTVANDRRLIEQIMHKLLKGCASLQDVRDALPDCLRDTIEQIRPLERMRPEAFTIRGDDRALRQYQKVLPRIEFYSAARLIY